MTRRASPSGAVWKLKGTHDDRQLEVERRITDRAGTDVIRATATDPATRQTCTGSISV